MVLVLITILGLLIWQITVELNTENGNEQLSNLSCPSCRKQVDHAWSSCPYCRIALKATCPHCHKKSALTSRFVHIADRGRCHENDKQKKNLLIGLALLALVGLYNYWSYNSGRCTMAMFIDLGPIALILILCILVALGSLLFIRHKKLSFLKVGTCSCGEKLEDSDWSYCPECGKGRQGEN